MSPDVKLDNMAAKQFRIGLALSGGGFRAAIFHLGVIRRLEELGIMKDVDAISCVSGGSIIAAYYVCEMETRLRQMDPGSWWDTAIRVRIFEEIARDFLDAVDHNLRIRALVFTPFYHPVLFVKTLVLKAFRSGARSELIQREYDKWFYDGDSIDQFPSVTPERAKAHVLARKQHAELTRQNEGDGTGESTKPSIEPAPVLHGPKVILNTTSLLTGERVSFSREPTSGMIEMKRSNKNSLPISRVVGASSGVPVLFPPTYIFGDMLVDGGVADNQGIEALLPEQECPDPEIPQILLVSDASGQLDAKHTIGTAEAKVFLRVNEILQFQVRSKLIDRLVQWKLDAGHRTDRYFAFTHLYLNLKDRGVVDRLPSEMIPGVARIRTDLDQFSFVERDALMYHGYTLIDAQIKQYCPPLTKAYADNGSAPPLSAPPLYCSQARMTAEQRDQVRMELEAGAQKVFLLRSFKKYPRRVGLVVVGWFAAWMGAIFLLFGGYPWLLERTQEWIKDALSAMTSGWIGVGVDWLLLYAKLPQRMQLIEGIAGLLSAGLLVSVAAYVLAFPAYLAVRRWVLRSDRSNYHRLTGKAPTTQWEPERTGESGRQSTAE